MNTVQALRYAPSVQQFLHRLIDDMAEYGKSIIVVLPNGIAAADVWELLRGELDRKEFDLREIPLLELDPHPVTGLASFLGITWPSVQTPRTIEQLIIQAEKDNRLPDILCLEAIEQLTPTLCDQWLDLLTRWAQVSQGRISMGHKSPSICVFVPAGSLLSKLPTSNVLLSIYWWWGFPSALETHLLCRQETMTENQPCLAHWREHVLPSVVSSDIGFLEHLWPHIDSQYEELIHHTGRFAEQLGWTSTTLQRLGATELLKAPEYHRSRPPSIPPKHLQDLWAAGALQWTPEYGLELHTAAVVCLGRYDEFRYRLWRGQTHLIFPLVNYVRLVVCNDLTKTYQKGWPLFCEPKSREEAFAVKDDPSECGLGHLAYLLRYHFSHETKKRWRILIEKAHSVRNDLAHYKPISFTAFEDLWNTSEQALGPHVLAFARG